MTFATLLLIFFGPFLVVAPFVAVVLREFPELLLGRRPVHARVQARPAPRWAVV